jgi:hypothetical protein
LDGVTASQDISGSKVLSHFTARLDVEMPPEKDKFYLIIGCKCNFLLLYYLTIAKKIVRE